MAATAAQIAQVRRMVGTTSVDVQAYIEHYPLLDENGTEPTYLDYSTVPPTVTENDDWIPTYDLNAAAADILDEKAVEWMEKYDFSADGGNYQQSQTYAMIMKQARHYRSRRSGKTIRLHQWPEENTLVKDDLSN